MKNTLKNYLTKTRELIDELQNDIEIYVAHISALQSQLDKYNDHIQILNSIVQKYTKVKSQFDTVDYYTRKIDEIRFKLAELSDIIVSKTLAKEQAIALATELEQKIKETY